MKLTVLMDNTIIIDTPYLAESGLSFLIETDDAKVVFDTGYSSIFISNARKMGIDMTDITAVAISHGHNDHTNGLLSLGKLLKRDGSRVPIVLHPDCLAKKWWRNKDGSLEEIGMPVDKESLEPNYDILMTDKVTKLGDSLYFLGTIPRKDPLANEPVGFVANRDNMLVPDYVPDDSAMVFDGKDGLVVINGCAHSGLTNILSYAQELFPGKPFMAVVGGFHMLSKDQAWLEGAVAQIKAFQPKRIYPCHCTDDVSKATFRNHFAVGAIGVGSVLSFD